MYRTSGRDVSEQITEPSEELAAWLRDVGRRTVTGIAKPAESSDELVHYLEELAGCKFRTRDDIRRYFGELRARQRTVSRIHQRRRVIKETALLLALVTAFIQYHFLDVNLQIARLPSTIVFVPVDTTRS